MDALNESEELLAATIAEDEKRVAELIDQAHTQYKSFIQYNNENSLSCVITIAYFTAMMKYTITRESPAGKGVRGLNLRPVKKRCSGNGRGTQVEQIDEDRA